MLKTKICCRSPRERTVSRTRRESLRSLIALFSLACSLSLPGCDFIQYAEELLYPVDVPGPWDIGYLPNDYNGLVDEINAILEEYEGLDSEAFIGLKGKGELILRCCLYFRRGLAPQSISGVNPAFALAMFRMESSFAKSTTRAYRWRNPGCIKCGVDRYGHFRNRRLEAVGCESEFAMFRSMDDGIRAFFWLLNENYRPGSSDSFNCHDVESILRHYCPASAYETAKNIRSIKMWMRQYADRLAGLYNVQ